MATSRSKKKDIDEDEERRILEKIRADLAEYRPGLWAELVAVGPACVCGLSKEAVCHRHNPPNVNSEER
jgi:hypothetical protein